jgi:predicted RNA-binding protein associated with RNAse of E/G family
MPDTVRIHYERPGQEVTLYTEGFISDDGARLVTKTLIPPPFAVKLTARLRGFGHIGPTDEIASVRKVYFYGEYFDLLEFRDPTGRLLGHYSDICTPLQKIDSEYYVTDLFLDLWHYPDGRILELDWDEFAATIEQGLLAPENIETAKITLKRLAEEAASGLYPARYLGT